VKGGGKQDRLHRRRRKREEELSCQKLKKQVTKFVALGAEFGKGEGGRKLKITKPPDHVEVRHLKVKGGSEGKDREIRNQQEDGSPKSS